jgi:dihydroneopterin aldolase
MIIVELKKVHFHAFHGLYEEEKKAGNDYEFNLSVSWDAEALITHLNETVNYVKLYELVKAEMNNPRQLLETLLMELAEIIHQEFLFVKEINMSIAKLNAPILNFIGSTSVTFKKTY